MKRRDRFVPLALGALLLALPLAASEAARFDPVAATNSWAKAHAPGAR